MPADLRGEVAVVTGVAGRLGPVWAGALLRAGADVVGLDLAGTPIEALDRIAATAGAGRFRLIAADVTDPDSLRAAHEAGSAAFGSPTVLVNNAGIDSPPAAAAASWRFGDIPAAVSGAILDVNALGVLRVCQVYGPGMAERGRGSVVNVGSLYAGAAPDPRLYGHLPVDPPFLKPPAYGMSKAAVVALTRYLAVLWGPAGVRVNTLSPGGVLGDQDPEFRRKFVDRVPLGRMAGPEDLTGPLLFLASAQSAYVTGQQLLVDGGYRCL